MWDALSAISEREGRSINDLATDIDDRCGNTAMTSAVRVFVLAYYQKLARDMEFRSTDGQTAPNQVNQIKFKPFARALLDDIFSET